MTQKCGRAAAKSLSKYSTIQYIYIRRRLLLRLHMARAPCVYNRRWQKRDKSVSYEGDGITWKQSQPARGRKSQITLDLLLSPVDDAGADGIDVDAEKQNVNHHVFGGDKKKKKRNVVTRDERDYNVDYCGVPSDRKKFSGKCVFSASFFFFIRNILHGD